MQERVKELARVADGRRSRAEVCEGRVRALVARRSERSGCCAEGAPMRETDCSEKVSCVLYEAERK